jgi:broad specificity phosphatase PhoE
VIDSRWREIDLGEWQGLTIAEVRAWDAERYTYIMSDPVNLARPGGESSKQVAERALQSIEEITRNHRGQHVLVVTHGGTIRNLLDHLGLWDKNNPVIDNTAHSRLLHQANHAVPWILDTFNVSVHLNSAPIQDSQDRYP